MKYNELERLLNKHGWFLKRERKKHSEFQNPSVAGRVVIVPRHPSQEVKVGTLKSILKQAGIK